MGARPGGWRASLFLVFPVFLVLLALLPTLGGNWVINGLERQARREQVESIRRDLRQVSGHLRRLSHPSNISRVILRAVTAALRAGTPLQPILDTPHGRNVSLFLYDGNGKRVPIQGIPAGMVSTSERFFQMLQRARRMELAMSRSEERLATSFFGNTAVIMSLAESLGQFTDLTPLGTSRLGGWFPLTVTAKLH